MLKHTMTYVKGPRTMSSKESDHIRHDRRAIKKSGVDTAAEASAEVAADGEAGHTRVERLRRWLRRVWWAW